MQNLLRIMLIHLLFATILVSCNNPNHDISDLSPSLPPSLKATFTIPSSTATIIPTKVKTPTFTPEVIPAEVDDLFGEMRVSVPGGGFSVQQPDSGKFEYYYDTVVVSDESDGLIIQIVGVPYSTLDPSPGDVVDIYLEAITRSTKGKLNKENEHKAEVDEFEGFIYDVTGEMFSSPIIGQAFIVFPNESQYVFGFGSLMLSNPDAKWNDIGGPVLDDLIKSLNIVDTSTLPECTISVDPTYGLNKENPIKVGGKVFWGPSREATYFENLIDSKGNDIAYERVGTVDFGGTILDTFEIIGMQEKVLIYVDEYHFSDLFAPTGFSCKGPFLLENP